MKRRTFNILGIITIAILGVVIGESIKVGNAVIPVIAMIIAMIIIYTLKRNVDEVMEDERIYKIGEKASYLTFKIFLTMIAILGVFLVALSNSGMYSFEKEGYTLLYSTGVLLILYLISYGYYSRGKI